MVLGPGVHQSEPDGEVVRNLTVLYTSSIESHRCNDTAISLKAGCDLFLRYTTRTSALELDNFAMVKKKLIERGRHFAGM